MKQTLKKIYESVINDSRIDFPVDGLSTSVWDKSGDKYILKEEVRDIILKAINIISENKEYADIISSARIVGSICSNQYTLASDIDVHFLIKDIAKNIDINDLNNSLKTYCDNNDYLNKLVIDTYPINFYFQPNEYQDLMSAGVYDISTDIWIIGPSIVPLDFNPYDEFKDVFPKVGEYINRIENILNKINNAISLYEIDQSEDIILDILKEIKNLKEIKKELKQYRRSFSEPTSAKEAEKQKIDKNWQKVDAVFKFVDKFGYLRKITLINNLVDDNEALNDQDIYKLKELL